MRIASIKEQKDVEWFSGLLSENAVGMVGKPGYYTICAFEEEEAEPSGVLQFYIGADENYRPEARIMELNVDETFPAWDITRQLVYNMIMIMELSHVQKISADLVKDEQPAFLDVLFHYGFKGSGRDYPVYTMTLEECLSAIHSKGKRTGEQHGISELTQSEFAVLLKEIGRKAPSSIPVDLTWDMRDFDPVGSSWYKTDAGCGVLLVKRNAAGVLEEALLAGFGEDTVEQLSLLVFYTVHMLRRQETKDQKLSFSCRTSIEKEVGSRLFDKFTPIRKRTFQYIHP